MPVHTLRPLLIPSQAFLKLTPTCRNSFLLICYLLFGVVISYMAYFCWLWVLYFSSLSLNSSPLTSWGWHLADIFRGLPPTHTHSVVPSTVFCFKLAVSLCVERINDYGDVPRLLGEKDWGESKRK
jgi:hypothetical protein